MVPHRMRALVELCIFIVHTLKVCTGEAGPEQGLVLSQFSPDAFWPSILNQYHV